MGKCFDVDPILIAIVRRAPTRELTSCVAGFAVHEIVFLNRAVSGFPARVGHDGLLAAIAEGDDDLGAELGAIAIVGAIAPADASAIPAIAENRSGRIGSIAKRCDVEPGRRDLLPNVEEGAQIRTRDRGFRSTRERSADPIAAPFLVGEESHFPEGRTSGTFAFLFVPHFIPDFDGPPDALLGGKIFASVNNAIRAIGIDATTIPEIGGAVAL